MNTPALLFSKLNVAAITNLVSDVSPYVRNRKTEFPVVLYDIPSETFERHSTGYTRRVADAEVSVLSRSAEEAETIAAEVFDTLEPETCIRIDSISREYDPAFDGSSAGIYLTTLNLTITGDI